MSIEDSNPKTFYNAFYFATIEVLSLTIRTIDVAKLLIEMLVLKLVCAQITICLLEYLHSQCQ